MPIDIGRRTPFGNPYFAGPNRFNGSTLPKYKAYLLAALNGEQWARAQFRAATGRDLPPTESFRRLVADLTADDPTPSLWCPGCKHRTAEPGVCHGSILLEVSRTLHRRT